MSTERKADSAAERLKGKAKETVGRATGNEEMEAEGRAEQAKGDIKQAGEKAKDAFRH
ncbi:CsbD family protein [Streptomyces sp. NPDC059506]|uniref:CsbD family protein n=1 Tax=Streptomyces TaxID=1883 RepID=UPI000CC3E769|nr:MULTISPECIES: CsbD family protein [unclassified Streptomyces]MCZ2526831.1 CsbD family protein [Streptomyces sp. HB2AG]PLW65735.1 CsbD family protein [Streptomyces sp. DJ]QMV21943.1 CsbD family protein [Streptomyces sp. SCUT-3]